MVDGRKEKHTFRFFDDFPELIPESHGQLQTSIKQMYGGSVGGIAGISGNTP